MVITKELLIQKYEERKTIRQIAKDFSCSHVTILNYMKKFDIPRRTHGEALVGRKISEKTRKKMSLAKKGYIPWNKDKRGLQIGYWKNKKRPEFSGKNHPLFGKHRTEATKRKISLAQGGTGIPYENALYDKKIFNKELKLKIFKRDNFTCMVCNIRGEFLTCHHIDYNKENCDENNLVSLHRKCHSKTNFNRDYWENYFKQKIKEAYCGNNT